MALSPTCGLTSAQEMIRSANRFCKDHPAVWFLSNMLVGFTSEAFTEASSQTFSYLLLHGPREHLQQRTKGP